MDDGLFVRDSDKYVKENVLRRPPLSVWWLCLAAAATLAALGGVALIDYALPEPLTRETAPPDRFIAQIAYEHLVNLTSIGPRVAGSYENEVLAVSLLTEAVRRIARAASPHNRVDLDLHTASGAFNLTFLDGMNNVYRGVQSVVARVSAAGGRARPASTRTALLLNCHFDTVPDSPGASDDGAGCAVALETLRALAASPHPLRHDAVFLFNGAEENIMQASHGFITQHKWAKSVRAFINIEACGAGGREVLFQAGPHDPWIMEVYAGTVPHPFASSLAQEIFESGLIPADTDFRIFRDFGKLSGVDLAWSANGYVYHTALDTAERVPRAALQRTGDNVLALLHGLLSSASLETEADSSSRQPVFFDVVGVAVVAVRAPAAAVVALAALAIVALKIHLTATHARKHLYVSRGSWWRVWWRTCWWVAAAHVCGVATSVAVGAVLHVAGARLTFYTHVWLLVPLYAMPAVLVSWCVCAWGASRVRVARGWWSWRACGDATCSAWAALLFVCLALRLRSGFLPLLWTLPAAADVLATITRATDVGRLCWWCVGSAVPLLQTWYLALGSLNMFVPIMGRAGPAPADPIMGALVSILTLAACGWMLPFVVAARGLRRLIYVCAACCALTMMVAACTPLGAAYSAHTPQRFMVFHVRRTERDLRPRATAAPPAADHLYWVPHLDVNTPHSVDMYVSEMSSAQATSAEECSRWVYCGAPYYLPVLSLIPRGHWLRAAHAPLATVRVDVATAPINRTAHQLKLDLTGPSHIVVIVSPVEGAFVSWYQAEGQGTALQGAPLEGPRWGLRRTYFIALYEPRAPANWNVTLVLQHSFASPRGEWAQMSVSGHALSGEQQLHPAHAALLARFPPWTTTTGWGVDMHLLTV